MPTKKTTTKRSTKAIKSAQAKASATLRKARKQSASHQQSGPARKKARAREDAAYGEATMAHTDLARSLVGNSTAKAPKGTYLATAESAEEEYFRHVVKKRGKK